MDSDGPLYIDESEDRAAKIFKLSTPDVLTQNTTLTSSSVSSSSVDEVCGFNEDGTSCRSVHDTSSLSHLKTPTCDSPSDKISAHDSSLPSTSSSTSDLCDKNIKAVVRFGVIRDHFTCGICHGILVDAFTIVECLHSFCRSCLIHNTYSSASCPTCGYKLDHVTPFKEIKCDRKVQDLVNAVFPEIRNREHAARTAFYWGLGIPPYVDKVYVDSANSQPPPGALKALTANRYDCSRVNLLQSRSNKMWFKLTAHVDTSKPKHFNKLLRRLHDNHRYISCPCYIRVGALIVALQKKIRSLPSITTKFNLSLYYNKQKLSPDTSMKELYFVHHKYGKFPIDISLYIKPIFQGVPKVSKPPTFETTKAPVAVSESIEKSVYCQKLTADGELKHSEGNVFTNLGFCNGSSKLPGKSPDNSQKSQSQGDDTSAQKRGTKKKKRCKTKSKKPKASVNEAPLFAADPIKLTKFEPVKIPCSSGKAPSRCASPKNSKIEVKKEPSDATSHRMSPDWKVKEEILSKYLLVVADPIDAKVIEKEKKKRKKIENEARRRKHPEVTVKLIE